MSTKDPVPSQRVPRSWGEFWQAMAYGAIGSWAVVFWFYPPTAFVNALDAHTRIFWLLFVLLGAITAIIGLLTRMDLKVELPGIIFTMFGPLAYSMSQAYYVLFPVPIPGSTVRLSDRYALIIYAMIPIYFLMVRLWQLTRQAKLAKRARRASRVVASELMEFGVARVETGPITLVATDRHYHGKRPAHEVIRDAENLLQHKDPS